MGVRPRLLGTQAVRAALDASGKRLCTSRADHRSHGTLIHPRDSSGTASSQTDDVPIVGQQMSLPFTNALQVRDHLAPTPGLKEKAIT